LGKAQSRLTANMPDFRELVTKKFAERAPKELPNWLLMDFEAKTINDNVVSLNDVSI